jgi:hypothetical protein
MSASTEAGSSFENEVANLYRILGYDVTTSSDFEGFQIDLIARRHVPGADETKLLIECKFKSSGSVSNEELSKLSNTFTEAGRQHGFNKAVMVTNSNFSQKARAFAASRTYLVLKTIKDLEQETLDLYSAFGRYKRLYQQTAIHSLYVPLAASGRLPGDDLNPRTFENAESSIIEWIDKGLPGFLTIMADFGSGKTTLLERIKFHYCDQYELNKSTVKPVLFRAKELHKYRNIDDFLISTVTDEFRSSIELPMIWRLIEDGQFLLLIDGFDEVAQKVDPKERRNYFITLSALFNNSCISIMTCRPTFFIDNREFDHLVDEYLTDIQNRISRTGTPHGLLYIDQSSTVNDLTHQLMIGDGRRTGIRRLRGLNIGRLDLLAFTEQQIDVYLGQRDSELRGTVSMGWQRIKDYLYNVYDIKDLMTRPILMDMICRTILLGKLDVTNSDQKIGAAAIYEAYLRALLEREYEDRETRRLLSSQARQTLLEIVALTLYAHNKMEASFEEVRKAIQEQQAYLGASHNELNDQTIEHLAADIILIGFLTLDSDANFRFVHKSFMEYLIARFLVTGIAHRSFDPIGDQPIPSDIIYFMGSFLVNDRTLFHTICRSLRTDLSAGWRNNLARSLLASGVPHEDFSLRDVEIQDTKARKIHWTSADLFNVVMTVRGLEETSFCGCTLSRVHLKQSEGSIVFGDECSLECTLEDCNLTQIRIVDSVGGLRFQGGHVGEFFIERADVKLQGSVVGERFVTTGGSVNVEGSLDVSKVSIETTADVHINHLRCDDLQISNSKVRFAEMPRIGNPHSSVERVGKGGLVLREAFVDVSAFALGAAVKAEFLKRHSVFEHSRIVGLHVEWSPFSLESWSGCEGLVFFSDDVAEGRRHIRGTQVAGSILFVDKYHFLQDIAFAQRVIDEARRRFGPWFHPWAESTLIELRERIEDQQRAQETKATEK